MTCGLHWRTRPWAASRPTASRVAADVAAGHKVARRAVARGRPVHRYNQVIGFASNDIAPGEHVHTHNLAMGEVQREYAFCVDAKPHRVRCRAAQLLRVPPCRRWRGHAQLRRRDHQRELLGHRGEDDRGPLSRPARRVSERRRRHRAHAQERLRTRCTPRGRADPEARAGGLRAAPEFRARGRGGPRLRNH